MPKLQRVERSRCHPRQVGIIGRGRRKSENFTCLPIDIQELYSSILPNIQMFNKYQKNREQIFKSYGRSKHMTNPQVSISAQMRKLRSFPVNQYPVSRALLNFLFRGGHQSFDGVELDHGFLDL